MITQVKWILVYYRILDLCKLLIWMDKITPLISMKKAYYYRVGNFQFRTYPEWNMNVFYWTWGYPVTTCSSTTHLGYDRLNDVGESAHTTPINLRPPSYPIYIYIYISPKVAGRSSLTSATEMPRETRDTYGGRESVEKPLEALENCNGESADRWLRVASR